LIEQAGGGATDGVDRILDKSASSFHARTPFAFGSIDETVRLQAYHDLPEEEISPLFSRRGLFNT
jgi:fructose-1,6-bisphosphatase I